MQLVNFRLRPGVDKVQQDSVIEQIKQWNSVITAEPLKPNAKHASVRRMYHAYVVDDADVEETVERLSTLPEIESADVPAQRRLIK
jgi:hypothetical protein